MTSGSKRKRDDRPPTGGFLHPSQWGNTSKKLKSPSGSGASTPEMASSHDPSPSNSTSGNPSATRHPGSLLASHNSPSVSACSPALQSIHPTTNVSDSTRNSTGSAWAGLEQALRALNITTKMCPPFASAVESLASCLHIFEAAAKNHKDYDELAAGLKSMIEQLSRHLEGTTSEGIITTITGIAKAIEQEIQSINVQRSRSLPRRVLGASNTEDDLIRRYRRIEQLFRQLQGEAGMSTWNTVDEFRVEQQLNDLRSTKLARFNSELSTDVNRRGCTKDTRTMILEDCMIWSESLNLAKIYWMNGMAGTGKTTIAYSLCEKLEARKQLAASFFCTRASAECREAKRIIPTIAYQLARRFLPFRYSLCQQLKQDPDISTGQLSDQFNLLLKEPLLAAKDKLSNNLVVVVDALDECSDPHIVELFLDLLFRSVLELPIKFFVTSRPEPVIRNIMMPESERSRSILYLHEIELSLVQADIELYLREELASIAPANEDVTELAEHAGNLFIYAATAVRYIRPVGKAVNSKARLKSMLAVNAKSNTALSAIDALYIAILTAAIDDEEFTPEERYKIRMVLQTAICACEPILIHTISALSGLDNKDDTVAALQPLRSLLHVSEHSELVTTLHASFPDFMFNRARSGTFHCDKIAHSLFLAEQCFKIMKAQLRFNICLIRSSFISNDKIPELGVQIKKNIPDELFYTCRFWLDHLSETKPTDSLLLSTHEFLSQSLLFWMEVMSLKDCMVAGVALMTRLDTWLTQAQMHLQPYRDLLELAFDAQVFVASYTLNPTSSFIPHIYLSALPLSPPSSSIRRNYLPRFRGLIRVSGTVINQMGNASLGVWDSTGCSRSVTFLPNDGRIVLGNDDGTISVQRSYDGKCMVQPFAAHNSAVYSLGISSDGMQIVSGSHDMTLSIWSANTGSLISGPFKGHNNRVTSVTFSPDAMLIVSGSEDCTVGIWNANSVATPMRSLRGHQKEVNSVAFSPDGARIISGSSDRTIRLWNVSNGATIFSLRNHRGAVTSVQFTPNGFFIISGCGDNFVRIWNARDGTFLHQSQSAHSDKITSIAVSPHGSRVVSGSADCTIRIWSVPHCELIAGPFKGHTESINSISLSSDGRRIMSVSEDKTIRVWSARGQMSQTRTASMKIAASESDHCRIAASHSQTHVAFCGQAKAANIHVWDLQTMIHTIIPTNAEIRHLQFSLDGAHIYSLHTSGIICIWNAQTAEMIEGPRRFTSLEKWDLVACSSDGTRVVTLHENRAELWHVKSNRSVAFCEALNNCRWLSFSQNGSRFITCPHIGTSMIWDADSGAYIAGLIHIDTREIIIDTDFIGVGGPHSMIFSPDGHYVAIQRNPRAIKIIDTRGQHINALEFRHPTLHISRLLGYSSDGWLLLSCRRGETRFHIWRIHINSPPFTVNKDGWVLDDQKRPLVWVPKDIQDDFPGCNGAIISDTEEVLQSVDYGGMLVGDDWGQCYIHHSQ